MAFGVGSIVMIKGIAGNVLVGAAPLQGTVYVYGSPNCDVLWSTGALSSENVPETTLSEITAAAAGTQALIGKRVRVQGQDAALDIAVDRAYSRDGTDKVVGQTDNGIWRELTASTVTVV